MSSPTVTRRAALLGAAASSAALAVPAVASVRSTAREADTELIALIAEFRVAQAEAARAWAIASPLNAAARAEMDRRGLSLDRHYDVFRALHAEMGAEAAEVIADAASEREVQLLARVRETRPRTLAGLLAKFDVLRGELRINDDIPRGDQDIDVELFNVFGDDLKALATA